MFHYIVLAFIFGLPLGIISAVNSEQVFCKSLQSLSYVGLSIPIFWLAPILLYVAALSHWEIAAIGQYNLLYEIKSITGFPVIDMWFMEVPYRTKNRTKYIATFSLTNIGIVYFANNGNYPHYSSTSRIYFESKFF